MREKRIFFRGVWGVLIVAALFIAPDISQRATISRASTQITPALIARLKFFYTRQFLAASQNSRLPELNALRISVVSIRTAGPGATVRVSIFLNGKPPPDGRDTRYFNLKQNLMGDRRVTGETNPAWHNWRPW